MKRFHSCLAGFPKWCLAVSLAAFSVSATAKITVGLSGEALPSPTYLHQTDRLIVKYKNGTVVTQTTGGSQLTAQRLERLQQAGRQHGLSMKTLRKMGTGAHVLKLDRRLSFEEASVLAQQIKDQDSSVEYAEPDQVMAPLFVPNDPLYNQQWSYTGAMAGIRLPTAWDKSTGTGIRVAVIDSGYRPHSDLAGQILQGYDFITNATTAADGDGRDTTPLDPGDFLTVGECSTGPTEPPQNINSSWHGTMVAGIIAALGNNSIGVAGVAFNSKIVPMRVLGKCGGYTSDIADAIIWSAAAPLDGMAANPNRARVINLSLGGAYECGATMHEAVDIARSHGSVVVAAAGNDNHDASGYSPAGCLGVVTVAAIGRSGGKASYSNYGMTVAIAAPGGDGTEGVISTSNSGLTTPSSESYASYQGTSFAAPQVAGVAALMLSANPALSPQDVEIRMRLTARPFPAPCSGCGAGIVNATAAVDAATGIGILPEIENNSASMAAAQNVPVNNRTFIGTMASALDVDFYAVQLPAGATLKATLISNLSSDYDLYVYNASGTLVGSSEYGTGATDQVSVTNIDSATAKYYVKVIYYDGGVGVNAGKYGLKLAW